MVSTNILGTEYIIKLDDLNNPELGEYSGKCFGYKKEILLRHPQYMFTDGASDEEKRIRFKEVLTHELIHAISRECGVQYDNDEALVDWIVSIIPKVVLSCNDVINQFTEEELNGDS